MYGSIFRRTGFIFVALSIGLPAVGWAQLPSKDHTPGKAAKVSKEEVCSANFTAAAKPINDSTAADVWDSYAIRPSAGRELVQLIPSSLGGTNDRENLWPLPSSKDFGPAQKKALDEKLHKMVCDGSLDLKQAQEALKKNWVDAYKKYLTP